MVSPRDVLAALNKIQEHDASSQGLDEMIKRMRKAESTGMGLQEFINIVTTLPRIRGQRIQWAQSLRLESILARHLKVGDLFVDELSGIKSMTDAEVETALQRFMANVSTVVRAELARLKQTATSPAEQSSQPLSVAGKFSGFTGKFGEASMFSRSLEGEIGSPDPMLLKGILRENILDPDAARLFKVSNGSLVTSDLWEYARLLGNPLEYQKDGEMKLGAKDVDWGIPIFLQEVARGMHTPAVGPSEAELRDLRSEFQLLKQTHQDIVELSLRGKFPGDEGDVQFCADFAVFVKDAAQAQVMAPQITHLAARINADHDSSAFVEASVPNQSGDSQIIVTVWIVRFPRAAVIPAIQRSKDVESAFDAFKKQEFEKLKTLFVQHLGVRVDIINERGFVCCQCVDESSLRKHLDKLTQIELNRFAGCESGSKQKCVDSAVSAFNDETRKWRAKNIFRVQGRMHKTLRQLMGAADVRRASLRVEEAIQAHMCTGPMCQVTVA
jgi:hypothetical protein